MHDFYLGLGSNLGDREENLQQAVDRIRPFVTSGFLSSSIIETKPYGYLEQPCFLNMVVGGNTNLSPHELLSSIKNIESVLGRKKTFRWGPRFIDIDILFYDDLIINEKGLIIPHADIVNRIFVLEPLAEIAPNFIHPVLKKTILTLLSEIVA